MAKTITISIDEELDAQIRARAIQIYGQSKGAIGKAISEALKHWLEHGSEYEKKAIQYLKKGYPLGGAAYKSRDELYERRTSYRH